jgi:hypothetical protein
MGREFKIRVFRLEGNQELGHKKEDGLSRKRCRKVGVNSMKRKRNEESDPHLLAHKI